MTLSLSLTNDTISHGRGRKPFPPEVTTAVDNALAKKQNITATGPKSDVEHSAQVFRRLRDVRTDLKMGVSVRPLDNGKYRLLVTVARADDEAQGK